MPSGIEQTVLENGLDVILLQKPGVPLVTVEIAIRAGSFIETPELNGLTHLHEHMFFKANRAIPNQAAYVRRLEELGTSWNGSTYYEVVRYFFTLPSRLLREGLELLRDAIQSPLFLPEELEKERKVVISEYDRNEAHPSFHLNRAVDRALFWKHYSRKNVIGDREIISTATREKLHFIQDQFYVPNNAALIVAGEFEEGDALRLSTEIFGGWERRPDPFVQNPVPLHPPMEQDAFLVVEQDVREASVLIAWQGPSVGDSPEDAVAADVAAQALNHPSSRFQGALVDSGLASRAYLYYLTSNHVGPIKLRLETTPDRALKALAAARREVDRISRPGYLGAAELSRAAQELITRDSFQREKARDFGVTLGFWWAVGGIDFYLSYPDRIRKTDSAAVEKLARSYLPRGGARTAFAVMVSPEARESHGITPRAMAEFQESTRQTRCDPERSQPVKSDPERAASAEDLENGVRLLSMRIPGSEVAWFGIYFRDHPGRNSAARAGLEQLLLQTLVESIVRTRANELARLGARVCFGVNPDYSLLGVQCLRRSLDPAVALLTGDLRSAEYGEEDVERNRRKMLDAHAKILEDPDQAVGLVANRTFLPAGHPYLGYPGGTAESLRKITLSDLTDRRGRLLEGNRILAVQVGDIEPGEARAITGRGLGGLPAGNSSPCPLPPLAGPPGGLTVEERPIPTCYVLGKFRAPAPGEPDHETLVLSLAILHRRLFIEVRSKRALTYAVLSYAGVLARNSGQLYVTSTRPAEALSAMFQTLDLLIKKPLSPEDFNGSLLTFLTRSYLRQESASELGNSLAREELIAGDYRRALDLAGRIEGITPADIQRVLREYVRHIHYGLIGPRDQVEQLDWNLFKSLQ